MEVEHWNEPTDGPLTEAGLRRKMQYLGYHVARYVYPPGTHFPAHTHDEEKIDAVVSGRFRITMGSQSAVLERGDLVHVPRGTAHSAEVVGTEAVVSLDGVRP